MKIRSLIGWVLLASLPCAGLSADVPAQNETVVKLSVEPTPASRTVWRHRLLPDLREMSPGNPITAYAKCVADHKEFFSGRDESEKRQKWEKIPLAELPLKELREYGGEALRQVDEAARLDTPDWRLLGKAKQEGAETLLDLDIVPLRGMILALKIRCRAELAERRLDDALATCKTMLALTRHVGEHPTMFGSLVGTTFGIVAAETLEELVQQRGCPNLYWALTELPPSLFDIRRGIQGERLYLALQFPDVGESEGMTEAQLQKVVDKVREMTKEGGNFGIQKQDAAACLDARVKDPIHVRRARERLVQHGLIDDRIKTFSPLQVILLDEKFSYLEAVEHQLKSMSLSLWQVEQACPAPDQAKDGATLFGRPGPSFLMIRRAVGRLEQRLSLLRHVEAIRLFAAEHDGRLPSSLEDVKLPLPLDPVTGKPFSYKLDGQTGILLGARPGGEKSALPSCRYEVTIRK